MFKGYEDKNADKLRALAKTIEPSARFESAGGELSKLGPISSQFFPQKETNVVPLDTAELIDALGGGEDARRQRFREQMKAMYPTRPEMWDVEPPVKERTFMGGMFMPTPSEKTSSGGDLRKSAATDAERDQRANRLALALVRLEVVKHFKHLVDTGQMSAAVAAEMLTA